MEIGFSNLFLPGMQPAYRAYKFCSISTTIRIDAPGSPSSGPYQANCVGLQLSHILAYAPVYNIFKVLLFYGRDPILPVEVAVMTLYFPSMALMLFLSIQVPYTDIDYKAQSNLWPVIKRWNQQLDHLQLVNAYGLFRRSDYCSDMLKFYSNNLAPLFFGFMVY